MRTLLVAIILVLLALSLRIEQAHNTPSKPKPIQLEAHSLRTEGKQS